MLHEGPSFCFFFIIIIFKIFLFRGLNSNVRMIDGLGLSALEWAFTKAFKNLVKFDDDFEMQCRSPRKSE